MKTWKRVLIIGVDSMDPKICEALIAKRRLPSLAKLAQADGYRRLPTSNPAQSPVAWSTLATGVNPGRHGIFDFIVRDPKTYQIRLSLFGLTGEITRKYPPDFLSTGWAKPYWEIATSQDVPATILRWPLTFPVRPFGGRLLSGLGTPDLKTNLGRYTWFTSNPTPYQGWQRDTVVLPQNKQRISTHLPVVMNYRAPLSIEVIATGLRITIGQHSVILGVGKWSNWVSFEARDKRGIDRKSVV